MPTRLLDHWGPTRISVQDFRNKQRGVSSGGAMWQEKNADQLWAEMQEENQEIAPWPKTGGDPYFLDSCWEDGRLYKYTPCQDPVWIEMRAQQEKESAVTSKWAVNSSLGRSGGELLKLVSTALGWRHISQDATLRGRLRHNTVYFVSSQQEAIVEEVMDFRTYC